MKDNVDILLSESFATGAYDIEWQYYKPSPKLRTQLESEPLCLQHDL
jgi:hypothetical protein